MATSAVAASQPTGEEGLFDASVLDGLRSIFGDATSALLSKTRAIINERLEQMAGMDAAASPDALARMCHEIGGMAGQIGLTTLSRHALSMEGDVKAGAVADLSAAKAELERLARASVAALPSQ